MVIGKENNLKELGECDEFTKESLEVLGKEKNKTIF